MKTKGSWNEVKASILKSVEMAQAFADKARAMRLLTDRLLGDSSPCVLEMRRIAADG